MTPAGWQASPVSKRDSSMRNPPGSQPLPLKSRKSQKGEIERRLERAEESQAWCLEIISKLIHDMSQPLTVLYGELHLLLAAQPEAQELRGVLEGSVGQVESLIHLVQHLRDLAYVEKSIELTRGSSLLEAIRAAAETFRPVAESKQVNLLVETGEDAEVAIPDDRLGRVVHQMLNAALERSPQYGAVSVTVNLSAAVGSLCVADQGPALLQEQLAFLLDPLSRKSNEETKFVDASLEWCLANRLAEAWWGSFSLESGVERGCEATLALPRWLPADG